MTASFPQHPLELAKALGISAIDTRAACLALEVRAVLGAPTDPPITKGQGS